MQHRAVEAIPVLAALGVLCLLGPLEITAVRAVPISLQSLLVVAVPLLLGAARGTGVVLAYLALGFAGAPVFAEGTAGLHKLWGPTGGFLLAFPVAAALVGWGADRGWTEGGWRLLAAFLIGHAAILAPGLAWLEVHSGGAAALGPLVAGLLPGLAVKSVLGAVLVALLRSVAAEA